MDEQEPQAPRLPKKEISVISSRFLFFYFILFHFILFHFILFYYYK
jgi:hypothetical protein